MKMPYEGFKNWIQEVTGKYYYIFCVAYAATVRQNKLSGFGFKGLIVVVRDELCQYVYDEKNLHELGNFMFEEEKNNPGFSQSLIDKWQPIEKRFYDLAKEINNNLKTLSDEELNKLHKTFFEAYLDEYSIPLITDCVGFYSEIEIQKYLKEHLKKLGREKELNDCFTKITSPTKECFLNVEKYELYKICLKHINRENIDEDLEKHAKKWFFIQNNYLNTKVLGKDYFFERMKEHLENIEDIKKFIEKFENGSSKVKEKINKIIEELNLGEDVKLLISLLDEHTYWQDKRKKANMHANHYIFVLLKEISRRTDVDLKYLEYMNPFEVHEFLEKGTFDKETIKKRFDLAATYFTSKEYFDLIGKKAKDLEKYVWKDLGMNEGGDIYGTVASMGKITAKAKIIMGHSDFEKLEKGDVLVTSMTRPEFLPIMKNASAVVTDEGGLTCHAAIVSRELGIPCIVGAKVATKFIKDGDLVEVNANHGVVRLMK